MIVLAYLCGFNAKALQVSRESQFQKKYASFWNLHSPNENVKYTHCQIADNGEVSLTSEWKEEKHTHSKFKATVRNNAHSHFGHSARENHHAKSVQTHTQNIVHDNLVTLPKVEFPEKRSGSATNGGFACPQTTAVKRSLNGKSNQLEDGREGGQVDVSVYFTLTESYAPTER